MTGNDKPDLHGGAMHIPRTRGAFGGVVLVILGAWAALIPFIGPWFSYSYTPDKAWHWTAARGWLEVLPGAVALLGGVVLLMSANRVTAGFGAWLGIASGAWLIVGRDLAAWLHIGSPGRPASSHRFLAALESIGLFSGVGAVILLCAATALGRLSIRSVRDVRAAQRHERKAERRRQGVSDSAYAAGRRDEAATQPSRPADNRDIGQQDIGQQGGRNNETDALRRPDATDETGATSATQAGRDSD